MTLSKERGMDNDAHKIGCSFVGPRYGISLILLGTDGIFGWREKIGTFGLNWIELNGGKRWTHSMK